MVEFTNEVLSEAEAALYDRQIRLWGLDAQKRLRAAKVLISGICGLGAEIVKNLVLAGVKSVTLLDHRTVTEVNLTSNFLASAESTGSNVAEASRERAQNLNPMVHVTSDSSNLKQKTEDFFKDFDVICVCRSPIDELIRISNICHQNGILFFAGDVYGMFGFMFVDLGDHHYVKEVTLKVEKVVNGEKQVTEETKMVKDSESFVPLSVALDIDWTSPKYASQLRRMAPSYFIMLVLQEFESLYGQRPDGNQRISDEVELLTIKNALLKKLNVPDDKVPNDFAEVLFGQLSFACAVVGGVLAQEVIKAVSQKDEPHNNFFFFNPVDGSGIVECLGY